MISLFLHSQVSNTISSIKPQIKKEDVCKALLTSATVSLDSFI